MDVSKINPDGTTYDCKDATARADIAALQAQKMYSTEEVDTGKKWIDGKTIYRKCGGGDSLNLPEARVILDPTLTNAYVDHVIGAFLQGTSNSGTILMGGSFISTGQRLTLAVDNDGFTKLSAGYAINKATWWIEYTKK